MLQAIMKEVNDTLESMNYEQLYQTAFDLMVDNYKQEFNTYIDGERLELLRDIQAKIDLRKDTLTSPEQITYLFNLYEMYITETWKLLGERSNESKHRDI